MAQNPYMKEGIDWKVVQEKVNEILGKDYSRSYIQSVYRGHLGNKSIKAILDEILPPKGEV